MATEKIIYIDPDASGSNDGTSWDDAYTGFQLAFVSNYADITSGGTDSILKFLARSSAGSPDLWDPDVNPIRFGGNFVCSKENYIIFSGVEQTEAFYDDTKYRIYTSSGVTSDKSIFDADTKTDGVIRNINLKVHNIQFYIEAPFYVRPFYFDHATSSTGAECFALEVDRCKFYRPFRNGIGRQNVYFRNSQYSTYASFRVTNTVHCNPATGVYETGCLGIDDMLIANNTIYDCWAMGIYAITTSTNIYNNLIFSPNNTSEISSTVGNQDYNATREDGQGANGIDLDGYSVADLFMDVDNLDLRPTSTAPYLDIGLDLSSSGITTDCAGTERPQGDGWDIGAFEYVSQEIVSKYNIRNRIINIG